MASANPVLKVGRRHVAEVRQRLVYSSVGLANLHVMTMNRLLPLLLPVRVTLAGVMMGKDMLRISVNFAKAVRLFLFGRKDHCSLVPTDNFSELLI